MKKSKTAKTPTAKEVKIARNTFLNKELIGKARKEKANIFYDRFEAQQPQCKFGLDGVCCKNCWAGPCRIIPGVMDKGICGTTADIIAARNLLRHVASGAATHGDHAREVALALLKIAQGKGKAYSIKDEKKLRNIAKLLGKEYRIRLRDVARDVALEALEDFRRQEGLFHKKENIYLNWLRIKATKERQLAWGNIGILPVNIDMESSHALHQTTMGTDADVGSLLRSCLRLGLADGYSMHIATDLQDIIFGTPSIVRAQCNLGVMDKDYVNIAVHGHVPLLSEKIVEWASKLENEAKRKGAKGIKVVGICCTGNEVLMRHGIHLAAHVLQAEHAIVTGALEAMVVDTQCVYPSLQNVASCYHTKIITTMLTKMHGAMHIPFYIETADKDAERIVRIAIENFPKRNRARVYIPNKKTDLIGGFSVEAIIKALSRINKREPLKPLADAIKNGKIRGIVAVVGCRNPKLRGEKFAEEFIRVLLKHNVLVVATGCIAHAAAQDGLMIPNAAKNCGSGLKDVLRTVGRANGFEALPAVLHMGSCVDNSRIEALLNALADYLKLPIPRLPVVGAAPEAMTEKAVAIAFWVLGLGIDCYVNPMPPVPGALGVVKTLTQDFAKLNVGRMLTGSNAQEAAKAIIRVIEEKRKKLGLR